MNDEKNNEFSVNSPVLDDIDYSSATQKKGAPKGVSAPILDDMDSFSYDKTVKKGNPQGVSAPILDDMSSYDASASKSSNTKTSGYLTDDEIIEKFSPEQKEQFYILPDDKRKLVLDYTRKQLGLPTEPEPELKAPVLDDENYIPPEKEPEHKFEYEEPLSAPVLDEAPETPEYVPKFATEDIEEIKREAAKKSVEAQLSSEPKNNKESLKMMQQLREEREQKNAKQGFKITIIVAIIGCLSAILFILFASGTFMNLAYKPDIGKATEIVSQYSLYIGIAVIVCSFLLITGIKAIKSLATTIFLLFTIILIFPGIIMLTQKDGNMPLNAVLYGLSIIGSGYTFFSLTSNNKIHLFFTKKF